MSEEKATEVSSEVMKNMAENIRILVKESDTYASIQEFEDTAGISPGYLSRMKKASRNPSLAILLRIAALLNVSLDALLYCHFGESRTDNETVGYLNYLKKQTMSSVIRWSKLPPPNSEEYEPALYEISYSSYGEDGTEPFFSYNFADMDKEKSIEWDSPDEFTDYKATIPDRLGINILARLMKKDSESRLDIILVKNEDCPELLCKISSKETAYEPLLEAAKSLSDAIKQQMCDTTFNPNVKAIMTKLQEELPLKGVAESTTNDPQGGIKNVD